MLPISADGVLGALEVKGSVVPAEPEDVVTRVEDIALLDEAVAPIVSCN